MSQEVAENTTQQTRLEQLSSSPSIWLAYHFLDDSQCEHLINQAKEQLRPSLTLDPETGDFIEIDGRTSSLTHFTRGQDAVIAQIEEKIAALIQIPVENGEPMQVLNYKIGQEYKPHFDYFDPAHPGSAKALAQGGQRKVTVLMYLGNVEEGGETTFPNVDLKVKPEKGLTVIFYSTYADGQLDPNTLHASVPVIKGEKWAATKWIRERAYC